MRILANSRVAILAGRDPKIRDDTDGGSVFLEYLLLELGRLGAQVDLFMPLGIAGGQYDENRAKHQEVVEADAGLEHVHRIYVPVANTATTAIDSEEDYFLARIARSQAFAESFEPGVFDSYDSVLVLHVANAFFLIKENLLPLDRTVLFPMMTSSNYSEFSQVPDIYVHHEKETIQKMKHICTPSTDEGNRLVAELGASPSAVFVVHRGFSLEDFPVQQHIPPAKDAELVLICANGIRPQKDHLFLLSVLEEFRSRGRRVHLHLTGNNGRSHNPLYNQYTDKFWSTAQKKGLNELITAHDIVPRSEVVRLMSASTFAVYPSKSETFGKSALESAASGLPTVVCDDVPAFSEFIRDGETGIVAPRSASAFVDRIELVANDEEKYESIATNGLQLRSTFSWGQVMQDLSDALQSFA